MMGSRGVISDKWSMRILWGCVLGSAVGNDLISYFLCFCFFSERHHSLLTNHIYIWLFRFVHGCCRETNAEQGTCFG